MLGFAHVGTPQVGPGSSAAGLRCAAAAPPPRPCLSSTTASRLPLPRCPPAPAAPACCSTTPWSTAPADAAGAERHRAAAHGHAAPAGVLCRAVPRRGPCPRAARQGSRQRRAGHLPGRRRHAPAHRSGGWRGRHQHLRRRRQPRHAHVDRAAGRGGPGHAGCAVRADLPLPCRVGEPSALCCRRTRRVSLPCLPRVPTLPRPRAPALPQVRRRAQSFLDLLSNPSAWDLKLRVSTMAKLLGGYFSDAVSAANYL